MNLIVQIKDSHDISEVEWIREKDEEVSDQSLSLFFKRYVFFIHWKIMVLRNHHSWSTDLYRGQKCWKCFKIRRRLKLIELCKFTNLRIANDRCGCDAYIGECTCLSGSNIDYVLLPDVNFPKVKHFDILDFDPFLSDVHCV